MQHHHARLGCRGFDTFSTIVSLKITNQHQKKLCSISLWAQISKTNSCEAHYRQVQGVQRLLSQALCKKQQTVDKGRDDVDTRSLDATNTTGNTGPELTGRLKIPHSSCQEEHQRKTCLEQLQCVGMELQACHSRCANRLGSLGWSGRRL